MPLVHTLQHQQALPQTVLRGSVDALLQPKCCHHQRHDQRGQVHGQQRECEDDGHHFEGQCAAFIILMVILQCHPLLAQRFVGIGHGSAFSVD